MNCKSLMVIFTAALACVQMSAGESAEALYKGTTAYLEPGGVYYSYVQGAAITDQLRNIPKEIRRMPEPKKMETRIFRDALLTIFDAMEASGFNNLAGFGSSSVKIQDGLYSNRNVLYLPGWKNAGYIWNTDGLPPHEFDTLAMIPKEACLAVINDFDSGKFYAFLKKFLERSNPQYHAALISAENGAKTAGFDIPALLASLEPTITFYLTSTAWDGSPATMPAAALIFKTRSDLLFKTIQAKMQTTEPVIVFPLPMLGVKLYQEGNLLILQAGELSPLDVRKGTRPALKDNPEFQTYAKNLELKGNGFAFLSKEYSKMIGSFLSAPLFAKGIALKPEILTKSGYTVLAVSTSTDDAPTFVRSHASASQIPNFTQLFPFLLTIMDMGTPSGTPLRRATVSPSPAPQAPPSAR